MWQGQKKKKRQNSNKKAPLSPASFHQEVSQMDLVKVSSGTSYTVCFYKLISARYIKCVSWVDISTDFQHYWGLRRWYYCKHCRKTCCSQPPSVQHCLYIYHSPFCRVTFLSGKPLQTPHSDQKYFPSQIPTWLHSAKASLPLPRAGSRRSLQGQEELDMFPAHPLPHATGGSSAQAHADIWELLLGAGLTNWCKFEVKSTVLFHKNCYYSPDQPPTQFAAWPHKDTSQHSRGSKGVSASRMGQGLPTVQSSWSHDPVKWDLHPSTKPQLCTSFPFCTVLFHFTCITRAESILLS